MENVMTASQEQFLKFDIIEADDLELTIETRENSKESFEGLAKVIEEAFCKALAESLEEAKEAA